MRSGPPAVEQPGFRQEERPSADAGDPAGMRRVRLRGLDDRRQKHRLDLATHEDDRIGVEIVEGHGGQRKPAATEHRPAAGRGLSSFHAMRRFAHAPDALRRVTRHPDKGPAHTLRVDEAHAGRDALDRLVPRLDPRRGGLHTQALDRLGRCASGLGEKRPRELPRTQSRQLGETLRRQFGRRCELGLTTRPAMPEHQLPRRLPGGTRAQVFTDQRKRQVHARRDAGGSPDTTVMDIHLVAVHTKRGKAPLEQSRVTPVRRRAATVEQAGLREDERARAYTGDTRSAHGAKTRQMSGQHGMPLRFVRHVAAGDDHGIEMRAIERLSHHHEPGAARDRTTRLRHHMASVGLFVRQVARAFEHRERAAQILDLKAREHDESDLVHGSPSLPRVVGKARGAPCPAKRHHRGEREQGKHAGVERFPTEAFEHGTRGKRRHRGRRITQQFRRPLHLAALRRLIGRRKQRGPAHEHEIPTDAQAQQGRVISDERAGTQGDQGTKRAKADTREQHHRQAQTIDQAPREQRRRIHAYQVPLDDGGPVVHG
ncbi:hypothetical protein KCV01_g11467, partial [Aureobasidium melanogenum]